MAVAKVSTEAHKGAESPANMGFYGILHFSQQLDAATTLATLPQTLSSGGALAT
jgi:hypothetical protein